MMHKSQDITWHPSKVLPRERASLLRQYAVTIWLTGLSASGKSTLACELERRLHDLGHMCFVLDGDNIRHGLSGDLGFSAEHRRENIRRVAEVANLFNEAGIVTIAAFVSPCRADRAIARAILGAARFIEVFLSADLAVCERRDPRGLYRKARAGEIADFTGISALQPRASDLEVDTGVRRSSKAWRSFRRILPRCGRRRAVTPLRAIADRDPRRISWS
jgi:adenylylsulfate kinase